MNDIPTLDLDDPALKGALDKVARVQRKAVVASMTPEQRAEKLREADLMRRDIAIMNQLNETAKCWVLFVPLPGGMTDFSKAAEYASGMLFYRLFGDDPDVFEVFKAMNRSAQKSYMRRVMAAQLPQTVAPLQLTDLATGEYAAPATSEAA